MRVVRKGKLARDAKRRVSVQDAFHQADDDSEQGAKRDGVNPSGKASVATAFRARLALRRMPFVQEKMAFFVGGVPRLLDCGKGRDAAFFLAGVSAGRAAVQKGVGRACLSADRASHRGKEASAFFAKTSVLRDFRAAVLAKEFRLLFLHHSVPKLFTS